MLYEVITLVQLSKDNDIAIITINNPPVNALSPGVPESSPEKHIHQYFR